MVIHWRKSSHSGSTTDEACIELARMPAAIGIRDSKDPHGPHLTVTTRAFADLVTQIKHPALTARPASQGGFTTEG